MTLVYLATPYNDPDPLVRQDRFETACFVAAHFMRNGVHLFSPIAHTHPIAQAGDLPKGWDYWGQFDRRMLEACDELWIVQMEGWERSIGVCGERKIAKMLNKPIKYVKYWDNGVVCDLVVEEEPL